LLKERADPAPPERADAEAADVPAVEEHGAWRKLPEAVEEQRGLALRGLAAADGPAR